MPVKSHHSFCHLKTSALAVKPPDGKVEEVSQLDTVVTPVAGVTLFT